MDHIQALFEAAMDSIAFCQSNSCRLDSYDVAVRLNTEEHSITVWGSACGIVMSQECSSISFLLGMNIEKEGLSAFEMEELRINDELVNWHSEKYKISIPLQRNLQQGDTFKLSFNYKAFPMGWKCWVGSNSKGVVPGLGAGETELCFEGLWLPVMKDNTVKAEIKIFASKEQVVIFNGELVDKISTGEEAIYTYKTYLPTYPTLVAGEFAVIDKSISEQTSICFYYQQGYETSAEKVIQLTEKIYRLLNSWLFECSIQSFNLVQLKRTEFGQYAPFPMVIIPLHDIAAEVKQNDWIRLTGMLAHEISHFWFGGLVRSEFSEQWLSEGFAQYMNLLVIERLFGKEEMNKRLRKYTEELKSIALIEQMPLDNIPLSHPHQASLVRLKGALVLHFLRQEIAQEGIMKLLKELVIRYSHSDITSLTIEGLCCDLFPWLDGRRFFDTHIRGMAEYDWSEEENKVNIKIS